MQPEILDALYRLIGEYGWNWRAISSTANSAPTTRSKNCSGSICAARGQNLTRFLDKRIMENPQRAAFTARRGFLIAACRPCSGQMSNSSQSSSSDRPQLGRRHVLAPPPFVVCRQLPIALALRHPSALIAIVLRSNKLQIALTQQADDNIYECKKPHIVSPFPAPFFLCAFILSDCQSHKQDCAERKCKKRMRRTCQNPATFKMKKRHPIGCLFSWWR